MMVMKESEAVKKWEECFKKWRGDVIRLMIIFGSMREKGMEKSQKVGREGKMEKIES
jgi:hypothetical protein